MAGALGRAGRKEDDVSVLRMEVESVSAKYLELPREVCHGVAARRPAAA